MPENDLTKDALRCSLSCTQWALLVHIIWPSMDRNDAREVANHSFSDTRPENANYVCCSEFGRFKMRCSHNIDRTMWHTKKGIGFIIHNGFIDNQYQLSSKY